MESKKEEMHEPRTLHAHIIHKISDHMTGFDPGTHDDYVGVQRAAGRLHHRKE